MKAKIGLFLFTMLAFAGMGFALPGDETATSYFNLKSQVTGATFGSAGSTTLILSQETKNCVPVATTGPSMGWGYTNAGGCVASVAATPENLAKMLETNWVKSDKYKGVTLELGTNIDLAEYSASTDEGKCDVNHVPLPTIDSTMIDGKGKSIKNLCYVASAKEPVGLFKTANRVTVKNIKFDGVRIIVSDESAKGESYHPAGALAGVVTFSLIDSISITNASIQGPIAGGLAGYIRNTTISNVTGDGVVVSNSVAIANGYAGSAELKMETGYNVFLGGLAGVAVRDTSEGDKTFVNDSVRVNVIDEASGHKSALGGIAGYVKTVGNTNENLQVVKGVGAQSEVLLSRISGGSSMGGLFGALTVFKSTTLGAKDNTGKFILRNSKFSGKISEASSLDIMAVGGLVGFDSTESNASFQIVEGYADIDMTDNLKVAGEYQYFAGGIVGYGASCVNGSGTDSDFLSVKNSKTEGIISLSASAAAVDGLHSDAYLGGIVGSACLAQAKDLGIVNDTSSVKITSKVKTAVDAEKVVNGAPARDSVYVGGVIGFASVAVAKKAATISGVYYDGSIVVEDSLNNVFVGGVLGGFTKVEGGKTVKFENVMVRTDNLISYKAKEAGAVTTTNKQETNVGGLCGVCNEITLINKVGVSGGITVSGKHAGNSLMVGGLVGASSANEVAMELRNAFSIGDISVTATHSADDATYEKKVGYLFGKLVLNKGYEIKSVYHYDDVDDTDVTVPFGQLGNIESNWAIDENIHYVVRNAEQDTYDAETSGDHNGTVKNVKRSQFAGFLNSAYSKESDYAWSYLKGSNNDLPIFAVKGQYEAVVPEVETYYMVTFVTKDKGETIKQYQVKAGEDSPEPTLEEMEEHPVEGYTFTGEWDKDFHNVQTDLTVEAQYDINVYTVKFFSYDGSQIGKDQSVNYMESAVAPTAPVREGYEFAGWSESYTQVKDDLNIKATYSPKKYWIVFEDYDGSSVGDSIEYDAVVLAPYLNERMATAEYVYTFVGWDPEVTKVKGDAVYKAVYDSTKVLYEVTFLDYDETQIGDVQMVEYGSAAVAPADPVREGYTFAGWNRKFDNVVKNLDVMATYEKNPESSSSVEISSSSEPESSSSVEESSSSVEESSSSVIEVSSSSEPESSSSIEESSSSVEVSSSSFTGKIQIVSPTIEKSGNNAIRLTFGTENVSESAFARVLVIGGKDTIWIDTLKNSIVGGAQWELVPAPIGKYKVVLIVDDGTRHAETVEYFEVDSEIKATPGSWQMVSLSAFDKKKVKVDDASFYWWDERNPVGDYWQYRAFNGESVDATRGFWYGTTVGNPLVIRESSGSKDSEIVWELDSLYSGWNLVANPYGWKVDLTKGFADNDAKVTFWRWNPVTGYEMNPTKLGPYEAVWAKVSKSTTWRMPAAPDFTLEKVPVAETKKVMHKDAAGVKGAWSLMVSLADDYGKQDSWNVIGAGVEETMDEPPAGMGNHVTLAIRNSEKGAKLAKSIKAVANEYSWILDVSANSARDGKIKFEGIKDLNRQGLKLFMTADGVTTEIKNENSVKVALAKSAKQVEVRVAASNAVVASSKIHNFGSTVAGGTLTLGFTAPETLAGARASYAVVGVDGKKVAAGQFKATAGTNQFSLNAPKSGVYFVKVKVGSQQLSGKVLVK
ncbi:MAG: InlB B-repeat-containing protein [Fibrobacter sp.]|nr:InlB B-repeat-containing protein [Fibrobacter sp.]